MSAELAVPGPADVLHDAGSIVTRLREAREQVQQSSVPEAEQAIKSARMVLAWVRINKASREIAVEACKLQLTSLRRIYQAEPKHAGTDRTYGRWLAGLDDHRFEQILKDLDHVGPVNPAWVYRAYGGRLNPKKDDRHTSSKGAIGVNSREAVAAAIADYLDAVTSLTATTVTVRSLTDKVADELGIGNEVRADLLLRQGIDVMVREAMRAERPDELPEYVTWKDPDTGEFVHIPWRFANIEQLEFMAGYRQQQAAEVKQKADELSDIAARLRFFHSVERYRAEVPAEEHEALAGPLSEDSRRPADPRYNLVKNLYIRLATHRGREQKLIEEGFGGCTRPCCSKYPARLRSPRTFYGKVQRWPKGLISEDDSHPSSGSV